MRLYNYLLFAFFFLLFCSAKSQEKHTIDFTKCETSVWNIDGLYSEKHLVQVDYEINEGYLPFMNVQLGKNLLLIDNKICKIGDGSFVRNLSVTKYTEALFTGEPALDYSSAIADVEGKYLYARGNSTDGMQRLNYIEKVDFSDGTVLDSIPLPTRCRFVLDRNNELKIADDSFVPFETLLFEYELIFPDTYFLYFAPRHTKTYTWFVCYSNEKKDFRYYLYNRSTLHLTKVCAISVEGYYYPVYGMSGFSSEYLIYIEPVYNKHLFVTIYELK